MTSKSRFAIACGVVAVALTSAFAIALAYDNVGSPMTGLATFIFWALLAVAVIAQVSMARDLDV
ncbi:hypothetical protein QSJ19_00910 [Gordonia sp. ABSL11-1]|uniref:hypothetical protein n=1 Tax=Gordonia sp. ABSL11-1 TaxID=3053924 RepID=UPI002573F7D5|nr:hypothetical protein [Gordonia sp. ABSL11-1]MDL9944161.1 hypothetical protein [Gordonia sp. ABSL11-1]